MENVAFWWKMHYWSWPKLLTLPQPKIQSFLHLASYVTKTTCHRLLPKFKVSAFPRITSRKNYLPHIQSCSQKWRAPQFEVAPHSKLPGTTGTTIRKVSQAPLAPQAQPTFKVAPQAPQFEVTGTTIRKVSLPPNSKSLHTGTYLVRRRNRRRRLKLSSFFNLVRSE